MRESIYGEEQVAKACGLSKEEVGLIRKEELVDGEDWMRKGRAIVFLQKGLERFMEVLKARRTRGPSETEKPMGEQPGEAVGAPDERSEKNGALPEGRLKVRVAVKPRNPRILFAEVIPDQDADWRPGQKMTVKEAVGPKVTVRVRDSRNFLVGMVIEVRPLGQNLYVFEGRSPRWRGRF